MRIGYKKSYLRQGAASPLSLPLGAAHFHLCESLNIWLIEKLHSNIRTISDADTVDPAVIDRFTDMIFSDAELGSVLSELLRRPANGTQAGKGGVGIQTQHSV